jgi:transcriptional regulator with XRE-family HTH domain
MARGRKPKRIRGTTLPSRILEIACRHKAKRLGVAEYTISQLVRDSGLTHSIVHRAIREEKTQRPKIETVRRLAEVLEIASDPELEDRFYNALGYPSPRQEAETLAYVEHVEAEEGHGEKESHV